MVPAPDPASIAVLMALARAFLATVESLKIAMIVLL
jgi:hypothetical protein